METGRPWWEAWRFGNRALPSRRGSVAYVASKGFRSAGMHEGFTRDNLTCRKRLSRRAVISESVVSVNLAGVSSMAIPQAPAWQTSESGPLGPGTWYPVISRYFRIFLIPARYFWRALNVCRLSAGNSSFVFRFAFSWSFSGRRRSQKYSFVHLYIIHSLPLIAGRHTYTDIEIYRHT